MGTDIHLFVEQRIAGEWHEVKAPYDTGYGSNSWSPWYVTRDFNNEQPDPTTRHYDLFAFLAGVRNGYGFAGVYRHEKVIPLFEGRGFPHDTIWQEPEYDEEGNILSGHSWMGDHSFTWATLTELLEADWSVEFKSGGVVSPDQFIEWREKGRPDGWAGSVSGRGVRTWTSTDDYAFMVDSNSYRRDEAGNPLDFCQVFWTWQPLVNCEFRRWCEDILKPMADGDTDNIRILFGFDS